MLKHYLKTTFKYLREYKVFSAINLAGFATALSVVYFALLFVKFELSYDKFNSNADRIYRISTDVKTPSGINYETSSASLAEAIQASFPEVQTATRIFLDYYIVQKDENNFGEETLAYADSSIFSVFSFPLIKGTAATVFVAPYTMVLSETAAKKYFGTADCLGKTLTLDGKITATVTGVMKDIPQNSHFKTDILLSMSSLIQPGTNWMNDPSRFGFSTYLLLNKNVNVAEFKQKLVAFVNDHPLSNKLQYSLSLEPLSSLYLHGEERGNKAGSTATGNYKNIYIFSLVALFVLFIASFNFINLTTAFSLKRSKEIGIRKVMGASKKQLTFQFLTDAVVLSVIAFIIAVVLCQITLPWFNSLTGKTISISVFDHTGYLVLFLCFSIAVGLLSGIYPAHFLSASQPVTTLKGKFSNSPKGLILRKTLVVAQFTVSIVLISATIIVYRQLNFMKNENLGFKKEHNLVIDFHYDNRIVEHDQMVIDELTKIPGIYNASISSAIPGKPNKKFPTTIEGLNNNKLEFQSDAYFVDYNFIKQYGLQIIAGREFSKDYASDLRGSMIINEAMVKKLGFANASEAIGKHFRQRGNEGLIIGVVKDFHFHSMHEEIQPLTIQVVPGFFTFLTMSISSDDIHQTIDNVEKRLTKIAPGLPIIYSFTDETFNAQYIAENRFGKLFIGFSVFAILISCLGVFGLTYFNAIQRTKEIGIRKILGASVNSVIQMLSKDFIKLVLIALVMATPIAWWTMNKWLQDFAYRINVSWWIFLLAGLTALVIALVTICFQAIKAAIANPVKSLRSE
jgi:putative ABC transport system permease protein